MRVGIFNSAEEASKEGAKIIVEFFSRKPASTLGLATGSTPLMLYAELRKAYANGDFSLHNSLAFALDEYVGMDSDHPQLYRNVLKEELVGDDKTGLSDANLRTPNISHPDPDVAAINYEAAIQAAGGVDLQILGIGADGHIGFNEPGGSLSSLTHHEVLASQTLEDNARFFDKDSDQVPRTCITQGLKTIMNAKNLLLLAFGESKREAVTQLIEGPVSAKWPSTVLQHHPSVIVLVDEASAGDLELSELYRTRWQMLKHID